MRAGLRRTGTRRFAATMLLTMPLMMAAVPRLADASTRAVPAPADVSGRVSDSASGQPLSSAEIAVTQNGSVVLTTLTDAFGRYTVHNLGAGTYVITAKNIGFKPSSHAVTIAAGGAAVTGVNFALEHLAISLGVVQ